MARDLRHRPYLCRANPDLIRRACSKLHVDITRSEKSFTLFLQAFTLLMFGLVTIGLGPRIATESRRLTQGKLEVDLPFYMVY